MQFESSSFPFFFFSYHFYIYIHTHTHTFILFFSFLLWYNIISFDFHCALLSYFFLFNILLDTFLLLFFMLINLFLEYNELNRNKSNDASFVPRLSFKEFNNYIIIRKSKVSTLRICFFYDTIIFSEDMRKI